VRRDGGAPVSASAARLVASTPFIIAGVCSGFLSGIQLLLMSGAEDACLSLSRLLSFFTRQSEMEIIKILACTYGLPALLSQPQVACLNDTSDAPVVRDGLVWHVKGWKNPVSGNDVSTAGRLLQTFSIARVS
jgi:hypothetical protein